MSDLISRRELIKHFEEIQQQEHVVGFEFVATIDEIKGQPTAYNVDKVVNELKQAIQNGTIKIESGNSKLFEIVKQGNR